MLSLLSFFLLFLRTEGFRHVSLFHSKRCSSFKYGGVGLNVAPIVQAAEMPQPAVISFSTLVDSIANEEVARLAFTPDESVVLLETKDGETQTAVVVPSARNRLIDQLLSSDVEFSGSLVAPPPRPGIGDQVITGIVGALSVISNVVFPLFLLYILVSTLLVGRRGPGIGPAGGGGGGPMTQMNPFEFGKSKDAVDLQPSTGVTFDDVAGCDEAKFELREGGAVISLSAVVLGWLTSTPESSLSVCVSLLSMCSSHRNQ
jgi:cell division protease FtsH